MSLKKNSPLKKKNFKTQTWNHPKIHGKTSHGRLLPKPLYLALPASDGVALLKALFAGQPGATYPRNYYYLLELLKLYASHFFAPNLTLSFICPLLSLFIYSSVHCLFVACIFVTYLKLSEKGE